MGRRRFLLAASREKRHRIRHVCVREIAHQDPDEIFHSGPAHMQARQDFLENFIVQIRLSNTLVQSPTNSFSLPPAALRPAHLTLSTWFLFKKSPGFMISRP